ncbi:MAG: hypothetical protein CVV50_05050 [Spirochaetae bacterium HGW-Spirochaetae-6]|nr:MAG: hypothetical protein CVV50_05050 [Spirochaetae bacterium HGW-Spirochaetae-6]
MNKQISQKLFRIAFLLFFMVGMCFLKLWYSLPVLFAFALFLTLAQGKRSYCQALCPMGTLQDLVHEPQEGKSRARKLSSLWQTLLFLIFWLYFAGTLIFYWEETPALWAYLLRLALGSMLLAVLLQAWRGKRTWCSQLCPLGKVMGASLKVRRKFGAPRNKPSVKCR